MTERAWTQGPWWTDGRYSGAEMGVSIIATRTDCGPPPGNPTRGQVAFATAVLNTRAHECEANARLIAAAPDLYEALAPLAAYAKDRQADDPGWHDENTVSIVVSIGELRAAKAALARAEGKS